MRRSRSLLSILLTFALLFSLSSAALANTGRGVQTPEAWPAGVEHDWYTAFEAKTRLSAGFWVSDNHTFTVKANVAKLTVENHGNVLLDMVINGQRLNLNPYVGDGFGTFSVDLSSFVQYGENKLMVQTRGRPGATATIKVEAPALTARILHMNDIHGKIDQMPKAAAYVKAAREQGGNVFFVNAGDNFSGNAVSDLNKGVPMIEILNAMETAVMAVGNHEFDHGPEATEARRQESKFPWLSANTVVADATKTPIKPYAPYHIVTTELGQKIAFIGLTETPPATAVKNVVGLEFNNPTTVAQQWVNELRDQVNLIVIVSHNGYNYDVAMAKELTGAHLIVGGHSHTNLTKPDVVNNIPIVQVGADGQNVGDLVLRQAEVVTLAPGAASEKHSVRTADLTAVDAGVKAIVDGWNQKMAATLDAVIGSTTNKLDRDPRYTKDVNVGNIITDAMRDYMDTEIAFTNNGGIRASIEPGNITMRDVYRVLPFGNFIVEMRLTGAQVKQVLEYSYNRSKQLDLQTSGLTYTVYANADKSLNRLEIKVNGQPLEMERVYTVAVQDFLATGGSGYPFPSMGTPVDMSSDVDALIVGAYIKKLGTLNYAASEGRIEIKAAQ